MITKQKLSIAHWLCLCVTMSLLFAGCASGAAPAGQPTVNAPTSAQQPTQQKSVVRIGWKGGPDTLNPGMSFLSDAYTIFNLVYDTMYELQLDNTFRLSLAESVKRSTDGKIWTYKIRTGIQWHDGQALTAHDIAFTYNFYHTHPDFPYLPTYTQHFANVVAPDDSTLIITLDEPIPNMEAQLVFLYILPNTSGPNMRRAKSRWNIRISIWSAAAPSSCLPINATNLSNWRPTRPILTPSPR